MQTSSGPTFQIAVSAECKYHLVFVRSELADKRSYPRAEDGGKRRSGWYEGFCWSDARDPQDLSRAVGLNM
jgi:hypothetical protein